VRLFLAALLLTTALGSPTRIQLLLRDEHDRGVAGASLTLRLADGGLLQLVTDAQGQAISPDLAGDAVLLLAGQSADGRALVAESYPAGAGFRLALIAGATRRALLRLDGDQLVLDPDMIFSPDATAAPLVAGLPDATRAPAANPIAGIAVPTMPPAPEPAQPAGVSAWLLLAALLGACLLTLALLVGLWRRRLYRYR
jgi:hypothetical protein